MHQPVKIAGGEGCSNGVTCPAAWDNGDPEFVYVQGTKVDVEAFGLSGVPEEETLVRIPRSMWEARS